MIRDRQSDELDGKTLKLGTYTSKEKLESRKQHLKGLYLKIQAFTILKYGLIFFFNENFKMRMVSPDSDQNLLRYIPVALF